MAPLKERGRGFDLASPKLKAVCVSRRSSQGAGGRASGQGGGIQRRGRGPREGAAYSLSHATAFTPLRGQSARSGPGRSVYGSTLAPEKRDLRDGGEGRCAYGRASNTREMHYRLKCLNFLDA